MNINGFLCILTVWCMFETLRNKKRVKSIEFESMILQKSSYFEINKFIIMTEIEEISAFAI